MTTQLLRFLVIFSCAVVAWGSQVQAQDTPALATPDRGQPQVVHVYHHYFTNPASPATSMASGYAPMYAWNFGYQPGSGRTVEPWKQDWGHLGFTGYLGQHGGGVDVTASSSNVFVGLVVDSVSRGSPAAKMGLVPGDFILKINGTPVDSYKQVAILFEQSRKSAKPEINFTVWNPATRRTTELKTTLQKE